MPLILINLILLFKPYCTDPDPFPVRIHVPLVCPGSPGCLFNLITNNLGPVTVRDRGTLFQESGVDVSLALVSLKHLVYH